MMNKIIHYTAAAALVTCSLAFQAKAVTIDVVSEDPALDGKSVGVIVYQGENMLCHGKMKLGLDISAPAVNCAPLDTIQDYSNLKLSVTRSVKDTFIPFSGCKKVPLTFKRGPKNFSVILPEDTSKACKIEF